MTAAPQRPSRSLPGAGLLLAVALLVLAAPLGYLSSGALRPRTPGGQGGLLVAPGSCDLGEVWETDDFRWTLPIQNTRSSEVMIAGFRTSCSCTAISPPRLLLGPGEAQHLNVTLKLSAGKTPSSADGRESFSIAISPLIAGATRQEDRPEWVLSGVLREAIRPERRLIDLGQRSELRQDFSVEQVRIADFTPLRGILISGAGPATTASVERGGKGAAGWTLTVAARSPLPVGPFSADLSLSPVTKEGKQLRGKVVRIKGEVVTDVQANPPSLLLGTHPVGANAQETVILSSLTERAFEVLKASAAGEGVSVSQDQGTEPGSPRYRLDVDFTRAGPLNGQVVFSVRQQGVGVREVTVPVVGHGVTK